MSLANEPLLVFQGQGRKPHAGAWAEPTTAEADDGVRRLDSAHASSVEITFGDACRNIIIFGLTGMGKSTGIMKPALERLIETGCSGLVLDCKEDYAALVRRHPERVVLLGASTLARPINLLADMPVPVFQALLEQLRPKSQKDPYWGTMAVQDATLVFEYYQLRYRRAATLDEIYQALFQPRGFIAEFDPWLGSREALPQAFALRLDSVRQNAFSILAAGGSELARLGPDHPDVQRQYAWHANQLMNALAPFAANPAIRRYLCDPRATCDFAQLLYHERKVAVLDMPMRVFGETSHLVAMILRQRMMQAVISRQDIHRDGYGRDRFTFLLADEFQRHLALRGDAVSSGALDDAAWFESSREYGHINIVATQGAASLHHRVGGDGSSVNALLQNFGSMVVLPTHDPYTHHQLAGWARGMVQENLLDDVSMGGAVGRGVLLSHHLQRHAGPLIAQIQTGHVAGYPHMGRYLGTAEARLASNRFEVADDHQVRNPYDNRASGQDGRAPPWQDADVERACAELREWFAHRHCMLSGDYLQALEELPQAVPGSEERLRCDYRFGGHRLDMVIARPLTGGEGAATWLELLHTDAAPDRASLQHRLRLPLPLAQALLAALDEYCEILAQPPAEPGDQPALSQLLGAGAWSLSAFGRARDAHLHLRRQAGVDDAGLDLGFGLSTATWLQTALRGWLEVALHPAPLNTEEAAEVAAAAAPTEPTEWLDPLVADLESLWQEDLQEGER